MNRALLSKAVGDIDTSFIAEACRPLTDGAGGPPERIAHMKPKRILTFALAAALLLALGITVYAAWSIHTARQQELKADLRIEENKVSSYVEYDVPDSQASGLVLLSSVNDGMLQHVYVNISPLSKEEASSFPDNARFTWNIPGTEIGGFAAPQLPVSLSLSGDDAIREAVLEHAYDSETQSMTLQCYVDTVLLEKAQAALDTESVPLQVCLFMGDDELRTFGPVSLSLTAEQNRYFDFGHALYRDKELDKEIEIVGLELTPFSAVWKLRYEGAAAFHSPEADWEAYAPWSALEDKIGIEASLVFSDGTSFSTGGALTCPYEDGVVNLHCGWGAAIDVNAVERIVLGDQVLWENK